MEYNIVRIKFWKKEIWFQSCPVSCLYVVWAIRGGEKEDVKARMLTVAYCSLL